MHWQFINLVNFYKITNLLNLKPRQSSRYTVCNYNIYDIKPAYNFNFIIGQGYCENKKTYLTLYLASILCINKHVALHHNYIITKYMIQFRLHDFMFIGFPTSLPPPWSFWVIFNMEARDPDFFYQSVWFASDAS